MIKIKRTLPWDMRHTKWGWEVCCPWIFVLQTRTRHATRRTDTRASGHLGLIQSILIKADKTRATMRQPTYFQMSFLFVSTMLRNIDCCYRLVYVLSIVTQLFSNFPSLPFLLRVITTDLCWPDHPTNSRPFFDKNCLKRPLLATSDFSRYGKSKIED